jgi:hypothetical protein
MRFFENSFSRRRRRRKVWRKVKDKNRKKKCPSFLQKNPKPSG